MSAAPRRPTGASADADGAASPRSLTWPDVQQLVERADVRAALHALATLDAPARRALARPLVAYERAHRVVGPDRWGDQPDDRERLLRSQVVAVVAAAVLPPSALAPVLNRTPWVQLEWLHRGGPPAEGQAAVARALSDHGPDRIPDLLDRLLARPDALEPIFGLVDAILREAGAAPPDSPAFRVRWFWRLPVDPTRLRAELARGPGWAAALEEVLTLDTAGTNVALEPTLPQVLAALAADGTIRRDALLDAALGRMQRPERPRDVTGALAVHDALQPAPDEVRGRCADYLAVLPGGPSKAAGASVARLRAATLSQPDAVDVAVEAARSVLVRPEKGLATAQLAWLHDVAARHPGAADAERLLEVTALAFTHPAPSVRERATALAGLLLDRVPATARNRLRAAAASLPGDLLERLGVVGVPSRPAPAALPAAGAAARLEPLTSAAETAEELAALLSAPAPDPMDAVRLERVLDALVAGSHADLTGLRAALAPVLTAGRPGLLPDLDLSAEPPGGPWPHAGLTAVLHAVMNGHRQGRLSFTDGLRGWWGRGGTAADTTPLSTVVTRRLYAIADSIAAASASLLLSTPTRTDGTLDPDTLAGRLDVVVRGGPPSLDDLVLALLRCPPDPLPDLAARVRELDLPAGAGPDLATWLRSPRTLATVTARPVEETSYGGAHYSYRTIDGRHVLADVRSVQVPAAVSRPWRLVLDVEASPHWDDDGPVSAWYPAWLMLLPHHREVVAAHLVLSLVLAGVTRAPAGVTATLARLADAHGPVGPGTHLALAYGLAAARAADRPAAVDALLGLATHESAGRAADPGWSAFGDLLGRLLARRAFPVGRVVESLTSAATAGAGPAVWQVLAAALPHVLAPQTARTDGGDSAGGPGPDLPAGTHLLLALAAGTAESALSAPSGRATLPDPGALAGLVGLASSTGTSRAVVEARRLVRTLQGA